MDKSSYPETYLFSGNPQSIWDYSSPITSGGGEDSLSIHELYISYYYL